MADKQTLKQLKNHDFYFYQDSAEMSVAFQAQKAEGVLERFHELADERGIPNTFLKRAVVGNEEYVILVHNIADNVRASMAVQIGVYGKDLRIQVLFAHYDGKVSEQQKIWGWALMGAFILFWWTGVGALAGLGSIPLLIGAKNRFRDEFTSRRNTFYTTVLETLASACREAEVDFDAESYLPNK